MEHFEERRAEIDERRASERNSVRGTVTIHVSAQDLVGETENVSPSGVMFFSRDTLDVTVDIEHDGKVQRRKGRLIRAQRMKGDTIGWALEFDDRRED